MWDQFAALLPQRVDTHPPGCHRPRIGDRVVFDKLVQGLSLRNPGDLVAALPYLLGYQRRDALVVVCLRAAQVCLTACQALPPGDQLPPALDALLAGIAKADPEGVIVLGYQDRTHTTNATHHAAMACAEVGLRVHDEIVVFPDGWRSLETGAVARERGCN